jgi:hypothetical protein
MGWFSKPKQQQLNLNIPNPETGDPKDLIRFIDSHNSDIIKQVYQQLIQLKYNIPFTIDLAFRDKITMGYIAKEEYLWMTTLYDYQQEKEKLSTYSKTYDFEIKGLQVPAYRTRLKECIIYEMLWFKKDPKNQYDKNAIQIIANSGLLGFVPKEDTALIYQFIDEDHKAFLSSAIANGEYVDASVAVYYN